MDNKSKILATFKDGNYVLLIEQSTEDPTKILLRVGELLSHQDLAYWAAPYLARLMQRANEFYGKEMEKASKDMEERDFLRE